MPLTRTRGTGLLPRRMAAWTIILTLLKYRFVDAQFRSLPSVSRKLFSKRFSLCLSLSLFFSLFFFLFPFWFSVLVSLLTRVSSRETFIFLGGSDYSVGYTTSHIAFQKFLSLVKYVFIYISYAYLYFCSKKSIFASLYFNKYMKIHGSIVSLDY